MNDIFLLLWLADVVGSIGVIGFVLLIGLTIGLAVMAIMLSICDDESEVPQASRKYFGFAKWFLIPIALATVLPNPTTIRALVAMRVGEYAVASPLGEKSIKALDAVLDRVISESKKSSK